MKLVILITLLIAYLSHGLTGLELLRYLNAVVKQTEGKDVTQEETFGAIYGLGYLSGFTDSHAVDTKIGMPKNMIYCIPETGIENEQLARVVQIYLKNNPEELHKTARISVAVAFAKAFPCNEK